MLKTFTFGKYQVQLLPFLFIILSFIILLSLGFWQLSRLKEKQGFLAIIKSNFEKPAADLRMLSDNKMYAKVKMQGQFLLDKNIHLYGRRSMSAEKDGYYLIAPFQTEDDKIILVARGWFSRRYKKNINEIVSDISSIHEITGVILPGEKTKLFVLDNDLKNNIWFTLDIIQASNILGLKLENYYLIMDDLNNSNSDVLKSLKTENLLHIRNDHLEYAITWFSLAVALLVIYYMVCLKKN
ncbi:MAG: SURF1 family protein [Rickettsia endosymbiont of Bryobia graminum]|nr:SURF1 family protein [Rickettsia endosymbiont of Bryobia graminum]